MPVPVAVIGFGAPDTVALTMIALFEQPTKVKSRRTMPEDLFQVGTGAAAAQWWEDMCGTDTGTLRVHDTVAKGTKLNAGPGPTFADTAIVTTAASVTATAKSPKVDHRSRPGWAIPVAK